MSTDRTIEPRDVPLGGLRGLEVHRTLPSRPLPTIGAWCFVDHFGPTDAPMEVLPHPHTGLQTVTWPIEGSIRHRDSLGSDVVLRPGELNLMTSGRGVSHSEFSDPGQMHGIQLWVALPDHRRHGPADFEHHRELPRIAGDGWEGIVLVGRFAGQESRATIHTPLVGVELRLQAGRHEFALDSSFEYGLLAVDGDATVAGHPIRHRELQYLAPGRHAVAVEVERPTIVMLIGGEPFDDEIVMWWNFVGRTHEEIVAAREQWQALDDRFGHVEGHDGVVIPAPPLPHVRLRARTRRD